MDLRLQPKPEVEVTRTDKGIISKTQYFAEKTFEKINQYCFPAHLIRNWRPKAQLLYPSVPDETSIQYECDFNRTVQNCFIEDYAEEVFLRTPPPCFVVIGKCGSSVNKLSQDIAKEYGSVLIQVDDVINQVIQTETETSNVLHKILRLGVSLTLSFILPLLSFLAHTPEARHKGYVLCGLPKIPDLCDLSVEQQFNYLFTWDNKPTVFINVLFDDEDLIKERINLRCETKGAQKAKFILYHAQFDELSEDGDEVENPDEEDFLPIKKEPISSNIDIDISPSRPWVRLPKDEETQVWSELELFNTKLKPAIELITSRVDPQYFITVDSRIQNEFDIVRARLSLLQIWKSPTAFPFFIPKSKKGNVNDINTDEMNEEEIENDDNDINNTENEDDAEILRVVEEAPQVAFLTLFNKKTISPKFRWELSHYNYICPVSLRDSKIVEGKSAYAVGFMKYIYFLHNEECMKKFIQNPRAYVLPIIPKPLCRFIIIGFPFTGKTTLAHALASEFSIPILNLNKILETDINRKKEIYRNFCKQKAECREILRLTSLAWEDWRTEEEERITLIENWIIYIQSLLHQRITQFYFPEVPQQKMKSRSPSGSILIAEDDALSEETKAIEEKTLEVRGTALDLSVTDNYAREFTPVENYSTASVKIIYAMKHEDFDFNENCLEVEANLFFASLWNNFANKQKKNSRTGSVDGEDDEKQLDRESEIIDWYKLLPPQSLSSLMMNKKPYTIREKRKSFHVLLDAASKNYWTENSLKAEFAKWRLPCFMDIPLCEIFVDNPILLLKYIPDWLKERPLVPDPIDFKHPSVIEAGQKAFARANVVKISQTFEEVAVLLRDAIEKAEREGMRVTGEVISPGGWVLDNMTLDINVWKKLVCENIFVDHIYILIDPDPEYRRILNKWCDLYCPSVNLLENNSSKENGHKDSRSTKKLIKEKSLETDSKPGSFSLSGMNVPKILRENLEIANQSENELDDIFNDLIGNDNKHICRVDLQVDPFCHGILCSKSDNIKNLQIESLHEEITTTVIFRSNSGSLFINNACKTDTFSKIPLGTKFQLFTDDVLGLFSNIYEAGKIKSKLSKVLNNELEFFVNLLTLPRKLDQIMEFLTSINRENVITKIDISGKSENFVINDVKKQLTEPFIKKPRELEEFEIKEIEKWTVKDSASEDEIKEFKKRREEELDEKEEDEKEEEEGEKEKEEEEEDVRIFGESGALCIVNLERNILLRGKPEFALRYYGKLYYFWNEAAKYAFIKNPQKYAPYYSAIRCYPPLRVFVMGPVGSGKTKLCHAIAEQCSLSFIDYITLLNKNLVPNSLQQYHRLTALQEQPLLLKEEHNEAAKAAKTQFMSAPFSYRTQWLESPIYSDSFKSISDTSELNWDEIPTDFPQLSYKNIEPMETNYSLGYKLPSSRPFISMKEMGAMVNEYIQNVSDLEDYCIEISLKKLWEHRPYATEGFVLEGFPMRAFDVKRMLENNWIPDLIIELNLPENEIVENNIELMMDYWDLKLKQETMEEKLLEDTLNIIQRSHKWARRDKLILKKLAEIGRDFADNDELHGEDAFTEQNKKELNEKIKPSFSTFPVIFPDVELRIAAEVDEILDEEFPPLEFNTIFETYDAGKARFKDEFIKTYQRDIQEINKIKNLLQDVNIKWFEIRSEDELEASISPIFRLLDKLKKRVDKKGEFAFTMKMETAEKLLEQGYYFLSKFGRLCPVQVYRQKNSIHMFIPLSSRGKVVPVAYRNYIYFIAGEKEKKKFIEDPVKYTFNEPHHPNIPVRVAVIGPPKSGKSTLCERLGVMFGLKIVTMGTALRFVIENIPHSTLSKNINNYLRRGCFLPLSLKIEALMACLNDPVCITQGFVLDGIPFDAAVMQTLSERGKLPFVIISLIADVDFGKTNRQNLNLDLFRLPYKNRVNLDMRYKDWNGSYKKFAQWNRLTYSNLYEVNAESSTVDIFYQAYDIIRKSLFGILYYVEYCVTDRALPLQYLCVSQHEYEFRKSLLRNNCPVCWSELKRLNSSEDPPERSGLVQYLANFYWVCPLHMDKFLKTPKIYFPPHADEWPRLLPKIITKKMFEVLSPLPNIYGYGRCPVTITDFPSKLDWEGSWDFAAFYNDNVYLCKNKEMLDRFLGQPWKYANADAVFEVNRPEKSKAVEELEPPVITSLPPVGFLEQTVAALVIDSLQIVGTIRPIFRNMSVEVTGCVFLALLLKSENPKNKYRYLVKQYAHFMAQTCQALNYNFRPYSTTDNVMRDDIHTKVTDSLNSENSETDESEGMSLSQLSLDSYWAEIDSQPDKQMWSAKCESLTKTKMNLTAKDELEEIPTHPKVHVILRYQTYTTRHCPLPPISRCITYIYSAEPNMKLPEPFNYNSLYQPIPLFLPPYPSSILFNPEKQFPLSLYTEMKSSAELSEYLKRAPRAYSAKSSIEFKQTDDPNRDIELVTKHFVPRFQFLDKVPLLSPPLVPKVVEEQPIVYNPQRDQTYMMLYAEFFHVSHVLRCYEWSMLDRYLELESRLDRNMGLTPPLNEYNYAPRKRPSLEVKRSIEFYHDTFDACAKFISPPKEEVPDDSQRQSTLVNFIQNIILDKIYEIFAQMSDNDLSYESFETGIVGSESKIEKSVSVFIREIFPYPPLPWDIVCRPYYAYASTKSIFSVPSLDNIAHERHFSLLDGIELTEEKMRFLRYPSWLLDGGQRDDEIFEQLQSGEKHKVSSHQKDAVKQNMAYFVFDFFNLPWTSFLTYPFAWAYNEDITCFFKNNL